MKAKSLFLAFIASLGFVAFSSANAVAAQPDSRIIGDSTINVVVYGLTSGSVDVQITNNGQTYYFYGSGSWNPSVANTIGSFTMVGDSFTITATPSNNTSPNFSKFVSSPTLRVETPSSTITRVFWNDEDMLPHRGGEIVVFFGN